MVYDKLLDELREKRRERESRWTKLFAKWNKPIANPDNEAIPYEFLTGDNAYFDKRKWTPVCSTRPIKKSKNGKIIKKKKVKRRTCPNVAINGINAVGERSMQQFQGNKDVEDELSPVLKKTRLDTRRVWKCRTDFGDQDLDIPVKRNKDNRKGCKDTVLPSVLGESVCNGPKRPKCRLKIDEAASNFQSKRSSLEISPDNRNACEEKVLPPVPEESMCNEMGRPNSFFKTEVDAKKFYSKLSYPAKSRDNRNAYEEKVLPLVPRVSLWNILDRQDSILKTDVDADKSRSKLSSPTKSRGYRNGCEHKELPSVSGECVYNRVDGASSSYETAKATNNLHSKHSKSSKSRDYMNGCEHKELPSVSGESVYNRMDGPSSSYETAEATNNFHSQHSKSSKSRDYKYHRKRTYTLHHNIAISQPKPKPWGYVIVESDPSDEELSLKNVHCY